MNNSNPRFDTKVVEYLEEFSKYIVSTGTKYTYRNYE